MGTLTIERSTGFYRDRLRAYAVKINGERRGEIKHGETLTFELTAGDHSVRLAIDWCSSPKIVVAGDADTVLICKPASSAFMAIIDVLFRPTQYISLERAPGPAIPARRLPS